MKYSVSRLVAIAIMILTMVATSSPAYAAGNPVFHMSIYVHNWRGDISILEVEIVGEDFEETIIPEPTEEPAVDTEELDPAEGLIADAEGLAPEEEPLVRVEEDAEEETPFAEVEQITPAPISEEITDITIEEPIDKEHTEGEINNDETLEPEG